MRRRFGNLSIQKKLMLMITLTSAISLLLSFAAYTANNTALFKKRHINRMVTLAHIIADTSQAAVSFSDQQTAEEILNSLKAETQIVGAAIYGRDGNVFAAYKDQHFPALDKELISKPRAFYKNFHLHVYSPVILDKKSIGLVFFDADTEELRQAVIRNMLFGVALFGLCLLAAYIMAYYFQRSISVPVWDLTRLAESVSEEQNYSLRAVKKNNDELGQLVTRFNEMLGEIQKRERTILNSNEALMRSNRDLEQFTYVASHDLQEPLRIVTVYSQLLAEHFKGKLDQESQNFIQFILEGSRRTQQLISDLLEYSQTRTQDAAHGEIDSAQALQDAVSNLKIVIEESGAKITHARLPKILADKMRITQLFQNLISNAIKFKSKTKKPEIHITSHETPEEWIFSVRDNGIGIAPEYLNRIFVIFQRLHTTDEYPGTGIGLAICKKIVEKHMGRIWVDSEFGKGCTFNFSISKQIPKYNI